MPSSVSWLRTYASARKPLDPAESACPARYPFRPAASIVAVESAWFRASASATPTSALKPEFDATAFVIANLNRPAAAALAMSVHPTGRFTQPSRAAALCRTPTATGESIVCRLARIFVPAPASWMYLSLANHAASPPLPAATRSAPSSEPVYSSLTVWPVADCADDRIGARSFNSRPPRTGSVVLWAPPLDPPEPHADT